MQAAFLSCTQAASIFTFPVISHANLTHVPKCSKHAEFACRVQGHKLVCSYVFEIDKAWVRREPDCEQHGSTRLDSRIPEICLSLGMAHNSAAPNVAEKRLG